MNRREPIEIGAKPEWVAHGHIGNGPEGLIECVLYEDGDLTVMHGPRGVCVELVPSSGYGSVLNACERLDVPSDGEGVRGTTGSLTDEVLVWANEAVEAL